MTKKILFLSLLILLSINIYSQCAPCAGVGLAVDYNSARISMLTANSLSFEFLSLEDYENGKTLTNATVIGLNICDCNTEATVANSTITGWELYFDTDDAAFTGLNPANTIPLCFLEAEASDRNNPGTLSLTSADITYNGRQPLDQEGVPTTPLVSEDVSPATIANREWSSHQLNISYYFAVLPTNATCTGLGESFPLINSPKNGDYYTATVSFTLVPVCGSCIDPAY